RIARRKVRADVARRDCSEQRVRYGVQEPVTIRVAGKAFIVRQRQPAYLQRYARLEFVRVPPVTDSHSYPAKFDRRLSCDKKNSASSISSGVVILMFR